jgi:hypothetical protein
MRAKAPEPRLALAPPAPAAAIEQPCADTLVPVAITPGELAGNFRSLRAIMAMPKQDDRLGALLDQLDEIKACALSRSRVNKHGEQVNDPDSSAAVRCVEVAARLLGLEKAPAMPKGAGIALAAVFAAAGEAQ